MGKVKEKEKVPQYFKHFKECRKARQESAKERDKIRAERGDRGQLDRLDFHGYRAVKERKKLHKRLIDQAHVTVRNLGD